MKSDQIQTDMASMPTVLPLFAVQHAPLRVDSKQYEAFWILEGDATVESHPGPGRYSR